MHLSTGTVNAFSKDGRVRAVDRHAFCFIEPITPPIVRYIITLEIFKKEKTSLQIKL